LTARFWAESCAYARSVGVFHVKHEGWTQLGALGVPLDTGRVRLLERYETLVLERAAPMGMVAPSDLGRLRERHMLDSLRAVPFIPAAATMSCDIGSGAGFPGIPIAIARPDLETTLVEVRRNRAAFLRSAIEELGLVNVVVSPRRIETVRRPVDLCFARAFGGARRSWDSVQHILAPGGSLIYWAGASFDPGIDAPDSVHIQLFETPALARSGSLVIMGRQ